MGFYDDVAIDREYPEHGLARGQSFQTKSLYAGGGSFTITVEGKLVEHRYRYEKDPERRHPLIGWTPSKRIHVSDRMVAFHGDILLHHYKAGKESAEFVARFTHGELEWFRPIADYPEATRTLLVEQGAR